MSMLTRVACAAISLIACALLPVQPAMADDGSAAYAEGLRLEEAGKTDEAYAKYEEAAIAMHAKALVRLGIAHMPGGFAGEDAAKALGFFQLAGLQSDPRLPTGSDGCDISGMAWSRILRRRCACTGWPPVPASARRCWPSAGCMTRDKAWAPDEQAAFRWYLQAAGAENAEGMRRAGLGWIRGRGTQQDGYKGGLMLAKAAKAGDSSRWCGSPTC